MRYFKEEDADFDLRLRELEHVRSLLAYTVGYLRAIESYLSDDAFTADQQRFILEAKDRFSYLFDDFDYRVELLEASDSSEV